MSASCSRPRSTHGSVSSASAGESSGAGPHPASEAAHSSRLTPWGGTTKTPCRGKEHGVGTEPRALAGPLSLSSESRVAKRLSG